MFQQTKSIDNYFKSNSIQVDAINLSPLIFPKKLHNPFDSWNMQSTPIKPNDKKIVEEIHHLKPRKFSQSAFFALSPLSKEISPQKETNTISLTTTHSNIFSSDYKKNKINGKNILLNQISVNAQQLKYFPIYHLNESDLEINIIGPLEDAKNFNIIPKEKCPCYYYINDVSISDIELNEMKEITEVDNTMFTTIKTFKELIVHIYEKIKYTIHSIQLNFILQKRKTINENLLNTCAKYIQNANIIMEKILFKLPEKCKKVIFLRKRRKGSKGEKDIIKDKKKTKEKIKCFELLNKNANRKFTCKWCGKIFISGSGLGGHMSRAHPNKSEQYKKKQKVRERRNEFREAILEAKVKFCKKYGLLYSEMTKSKEKKEKLKKLIIQNRKEYSEILKHIKIVKGLIYN